MKKPTLITAVLAALLCASALFAYEAGGFAYTKRVETRLLAEPKPLATATGILAFGRKVQINEVQGAWLNISDGPANGWVFVGNLSDAKPAEGKGLDAVPLLASKTTATAAARPLTPATVAYASQKNLSAAKDDLEWMLTACHAITSEDVETFMAENKRGEFQ